MVHTEKSLFRSYENLLNSTILQQPNNFYMRKSEKILIKKGLIKGCKLRVKKKNMYPAPSVESTMQTITSVPINIPTPAVLDTCYHYQQDYTYPLTLSGWHPMNSSLFTIKSVPIIPIIPSPAPIFATHLGAFAGTVIQPVVIPIVPDTFMQVNTTAVACINEYNDNVTDEMNKPHYEEKETVTLLHRTTDLNEEVEYINFDHSQSQSDPLETYFTLPRELFPTARMMTLDPNPLIDAFCKMHNLQQHTPWLLDLEFGIPRTVVTRPIPTYNAKFNSIHCKNTPDAIHPGFESCDPDFKKVVLFYYDCIVSMWYKGYTILKCDRSVDNFQSWLVLPMQVLGMCWP